MLTCPYCRAEVPDDSHFCDQCGKAFMFCPECGKPKRGTVCAACGVELISSEVHFSSDADGLSLVGEGLTLPLMEGDFGRRGGMWPELGSFQYVSGSHGHIGHNGTAWTITDFGSTNGTKVNGIPLQKDIPTIFKAGDTIVIATYTFNVK